MKVAALTGADLEAHLEDVARLRIAVFRDFPYLYDGDLAYEQRYLQAYRNSARSVLIGAFEGTTLVGAATGAPMEDHASDFAAAFAGQEIALSEIFYAAESVLLPDFRGRGIGHAFFEHRESFARKMGRRYMAFCSVVRPEGHDLQPAEYRALDPFWRKRGYAPLPGAVAHFSWKDVDQPQESAKPLQFWMRAL